MVLCDVQATIFFHTCEFFWSGRGYTSIPRSGPALSERVQYPPALGDGGNTDTRPAALAVDEHCRVVDCTATCSQRQQGKEQQHH